MSVSMRASKLGLAGSIVVALLWGWWLGGPPARRVAAAPNTTPVINGVIAAGEYGSHVDGQNQQTSGGTVAYMTWDAANLYIAYANANVGEGVVVYLDTNPVIPATGGTNADGNLTGQNYDGTNFAALPFRADFVTYFKIGYREYRTADGVGGWSAATAGFGTYADDSGTTRELAIPWSALGGQPARFNFFAYATSAGGFVYGQVPSGNAGGTIGTAATYNQAYRVANLSGLPFAAPQSLITVNTTTDELNADGDCSLREAISAANANAAVDACTAGVGGDTVSVPAGTYLLTLATTNDNANANGDLDATDAAGLTLVGASASGTIVSANGLNDRVLHAVAGPLMVQSLTIRDGKVTGTGGGVSAASTLTLSDTQLISNTATNSLGGGAYAAGVVYLYGGLIQSNLVTVLTVGNGFGGGLYTASNLVLTDTQLISNTSQANAAGLYSLGTTSLNGGLFQGNYAIAESGGGVYSVGNLVMTNTQFINNRAGSAGGGAIVLNNAKLTGGLFQNNISEGAGAGIQTGGTLDVNGTQFIHNQTPTSVSSLGAGAFAGGAATFNGGLFQDNYSYAGGGGLYAGSTLALTDTQFISNTTGNHGIAKGGGLYVAGAATLNNVLFQNNVCSTVNCLSGGWYAANTLTLMQAISTTDNVHNQGLTTQATAGTLWFNGTAKQTIAGTGSMTLNALWINNGGAGVYLGQHITVTDKLTLTNDLTTTASYQLNLTANATTAGTGDVWGNTYRQHTFNSDTPYAFGNPNVSVSFGPTSTVPTALLINLQPVRPSAFSFAARRAYTVTATGGGAFTATLRLHYQDAELSGPEASLQLWRYNGSTWAKQNTTAVDMAANWVERSGVEAFSAWGLSSITPLAIELRAFDAAAANRVPIIPIGLGVMLALTGMLILIKRKRVTSA